MGSVVLALEVGNCGGVAVRVIAGPGEVHELPVVAGSLDGAGLGLLAAGAGTGLDAGFLTAGLGGHGPLAPIMAQGLDGHFLGASIGLALEDGGSGIHRLAVLGAGGGGSRTGDGALCRLGVSLVELAGERSGGGGVAVGVITGPGPGGLFPVVIAVDGLHRGVHAQLCLREVVELEQIQGKCVAALDVVLGQGEGPGEDHVTGFHIHTQTILGVGREEHGVQTDITHVREIIALCLQKAEGFAVKGQCAGDSAQAEIGVSHQFHGHGVALSAVAQQDLGSGGFFLGVA